MKGHSSNVNSVAFSPCGKQLASASSDKTVRLWSSESGECLFVLKGHIDGVSGVAYCTEGKRLVSVSKKDGTIREWNPKTGEPVACWNIAHEKDSTLTISADGQWVAVTLIGKIQITNAITGEAGPVLNTKSQVNNITISSNGQWIVTWNSGDNTLRLWDISSGSIISSFSGHSGGIHTCTFSPSCLQIASGDGDGYVRFWEVDTSRAILDLDRPTGRVLAVTYSPDGRSILSYSNHQGVQQWDSRTGMFTPLPLKISDDVSSCSFSPDGNQIATGHMDGTIRLLNRQADIAEYTLLEHADEVDQLVYSPCGRWIVFTVSNEAQLWDLQTNEHLGPIGQIRELSISCVAFTPTIPILLVSNGFTICLYDLRAQDPYTALKEMRTDFMANSLVCSPDGQEVAISTFEGPVCLWNFQSDKPYIELTGHYRWVDSIAYSPCGKWILSGGCDRTVRVWRFGPGEISCWSCVAVVGGCSNAVLSLAWNPVVALEFVTGCKDGFVRVWRIASMTTPLEGKSLSRCSGVKLWDSFAQWT